MSEPKTASQGSVDSVVFRSVAITLRLAEIYATARSLGTSDEQFLETVNDAIKIVRESVEPVAASVRSAVEDHFQKVQSDGDSPAVLRDPKETPP